MFQSYGKFQPRKDQLERIAPVIVKMGCFARVETNGGAFEQVNLLYGENPNQAVRAVTKIYHEAGIKTHMLDRGLNALRMFPCSADLRRLQYKVKHAQGVDIPRIFCGLNDVRNIIPSIKWALEAGMTPQATLCITNSPIHTAEYYSAIADQLIAAGAPEICLKDMAGIGQPALLGKLCGLIKKNHPDVIVEYHGHSGPGLQMASILELAKNGVDIIDTAMEPLSWGKGHADIISVQSMLKNYGFDVPEINMKAYMEARKLTQEFLDDFLGYFVNPNNHLESSLLLGCGLPGGMMGSMMADLKGAMGAINSNREKKGEPAYTEDELLIRLFDEVGYVWPRVGYPPLVTPFSQYVKNMWGMILGKSGKLPGEVAPEIVELAKEKGFEFYTDDPQALYPDNLDQFRKEMEENGWDLGPDDEELYEFAMHERQYRDYKSGEAKKRFLADLQAARDKALGGGAINEAEALAFKHAKADALVAPESGIVLYEIGGDAEAVMAIEPYIGKVVAEGERFCYIENNYGQIVEIPAALGGTLVEIATKQGGHVSKGDVLAYVQRPEE